MYLSLPLVLSVLGLALADDVWNFGDWDDDYSYTGYQPTGLLQGGSQSIMRYPTYRRYRGSLGGSSGVRGSLGSSSGVRGSLGGSSGFRGNLGSTGISYNTGYSRNKGYGSYGTSYSGSRGYGSKGNNYGSGMITTGSLGTSIRPLGRSRYHSKSSSIIQPRGNIGNNFGIRSLNDDDDFDDINIGILGPSVARGRTGSRSVRPTIVRPTVVRPTIKNYPRKSAIRPIINNIASPINIRRSFDNDEDDINRGVLGPAVVRNGGSRASVRPIAKQTYHRKLASVRTTGSAGVATSPLRTSFDDDNDDFDDVNGILGFSSAGRPSGIARKISPRRGSIGGSAIGIQPRFGNDGDDFDRNIQDDFNGDFNDDFNGDFNDDFNRGILGASVNRNSGILGASGNRNSGILGASGNRNGGILGASVKRAGPTSTGSIRGSLGPAINRGGHSSHSKSSNYHRNPHQNIHVTHVHRYQPDYDEDNFGSAPVFNSRPVIGGGYAGYATQYPQYGSYGYSTGNSYSNGGGFGTGNFGGGSGFRGRFRGSGGGSGGRGGSGGSGGSGSGGGDSDDFDFDDDENGSSGGSGSGGGFGSGFNSIGGIGGVAGRFVGGGFGSVGGIGSMGGSQGRYYSYGVYPNSRNINHNTNYKNSYGKSY